MKSIGFVKTPLAFYTRSKQTPPPIFLALKVPADYEEALLSANPFADALELTETYLGYGRGTFPCYSEWCRMQEPLTRDGE